MRMHVHHLGSPQLRKTIEIVQLMSRISSGHPAPFTLLVPPVLLDHVPVLEFGQDPGASGRTPLLQLAQPSLQVCAGRFEQAESHFVSRRFGGA